MKDFIKVYPEASVYNLNINYRSNRYVVDMATHLINHNQDRFYKDLKAFHSYGDKVNIREFTNITEQNQYMIALIYQWKELAILTRTNNCAVNIVKMLEHQGIAVQSSTSKAKDNLSGHWITLDIGAYIKIANGSKNYK